MTRFRKPAILALAVLLLLSCFPAWAETAESAEQTLIRLVNEDRARYGLNALTVDPALCSVARIKAQDMLSGSYFAHTSPTYGDIRKMLTTFDVPYTYASENIARSRDVTHAQAQFLSSSTGHRQTLLGSQWTRMGVGVAITAQGFVYVSQIFAR